MATRKQEYADLVWDFIWHNGEVTSNEVMLGTGLNYSQFTQAKEYIRDNYQVLRSQELAGGWLYDTRTMVTSYYYWFPDTPAAGKEWLQRRTRSVLTQVRRCLTTVEAMRDHYGRSNRSLRTVHRDLTRVREDLEDMLS